MLSDERIEVEHERELAFMDLFEKHGLYFEYGYAWSLSAYEN